jgi:integrase
MPHFPQPFFRKDRKLWYVQIAGKQHNLGPDEAAARLAYHALMSEPRNAPKVARPSQPRPTVLEISDAFLTWTEKHRAARTYDWYLARLQAFIDSTPKGLTIDELRQHHVDDWVDSHAGWSDGHKRGCMIAICAAMNWALKKGKITRNPLAGIEKPKAGRREQIITPEIFKQMLAYVRDEPFRDLITVCNETGCRPQEIVAVEKKHLDLKNSRWVFPRGEAKGKRRIRIIYLTEKALEISKRLAEKHPTGKLFRNADSEPWNRFSINCRFCRLKKKLGVKYALGAFRHSFATRMLQAGVDALVVAQLLGHADLSMLGRVYAHLSQDPKHLLDQMKKAAG